MVNIGYVTARPFYLLFGRADARSECFAPIFTFS